MSVECYLSFIEIYRNCMRFFLSHEKITGLSPVTMILASIKQQTDGFVFGDPNKDVWRMTNECGLLRVKSIWYQQKSQPNFLWSNVGRTRESQGRHLRVQLVIRDTVPRVSKIILSYRYCPCCAPTGISRLRFAQCMSCRSLQCLRPRGSHY